MSKIQASMVVQSTYPGRTVNFFFLMKNKTQARGSVSWKGFVTCNKRDSIQHYHVTDQTTVEQHKTKVITVFNISLSLFFVFTSI